MLLFDPLTLLAGIVVLYLLWLTGMGVRCLIYGGEPRYTWSEYLIDICTGIILAVAVYALGVTKLRSVFVVALILTVLLFLLQRPLQPGPVSLRAGFTAAHKFFFMGIPFYVVLFLFSCSLRPGNDNFHYMNVAEFGSLYGLENMFPQYARFRSLDENYLKNDSYHYFDTWFNAVLFRSFRGIDNLSVHRNMVYPLFAFTGYVAVLSIFETIKKKTPGFSEMAVGFFFLFLALYFPFGKTSLLLPDLKPHHPFNQHKFALILPLFAIIHYLAAEKKTAGLLYAVALAPVLHIITAPLVFVFVFAFVVTGGLKEKKDRRLLLLPLISVVCILLFYKMSGVRSDTPFSMYAKGTNPYSRILTAEYLSVVGAQLKSSLVHLLYLVPVLVLLLPFYKDIVRAFRDADLFFVFVILTIAAGLCLDAFLYLFYADSWQFLMFYTEYPVLVLCISAAVIALVHSRESLLKKTAGIVIAAGAFAGFCRYVLRPGTDNTGTEVSGQFVREAAKYRQELDGVGVFLPDTTGYFSSVRMSIHYLPPFTGFLKRISKNSTAVSLNVPAAQEMDRYRTFHQDIPTYQMICQSLAKTPMYKYAVQHENTDRLSQQTGFIRQFKINFLIAESGVPVDSRISSLFQVQLKDERTGMTLFLKRNTD